MMLSFAALEKTLDSQRKMRGLKIKMAFTIGLSKAGLDLKKGTLPEIVNR